MFRVMMEQFTSRTLHTSFASEPGQVTYILIPQLQIIVTLYRRNKAAMSDLIERLACSNW